MSHTDATQSPAPHLAATEPPPPLPTPDQLPDNVPILKGMIVELLLTLRQRDRDLAETRQRVDLLLRRLFGPRRERFNPDQQLLFAELLAGQEQPANEPSTPAEQDKPETLPKFPKPELPPKKRCRPHGRRRLPEDLPRRPVHHELTEAERLCVCGQMRVDISAEVSGEQLDWQPACYFVWQHWIHKYVCPSCTRKAAAQTATDPLPAGTTVNSEASHTPAPEQQAPPATPLIAVTPAAAAVAAAGRGPAIIAAAKPPMPIDKGLPGPGLLAHIIVSKYFDHLPLYRQEKIFERQGVVLARSTTCDWMAACAELLRPLYRLMVAAVLQSRWLHTDDTPVKNLKPAPGGTATARFWIYYGDRQHAYNVFDFTLNRRRDGPQNFLAGFHGYLHADAFSGYDALYLPGPVAGKPPIIEVACNAHARRKFYEARTSDAARAHQALGYYRQLYELERSAGVNKFDDTQRLLVRREFSVMILDQFHDWLEQQRPAVTPKSPIAEAIGYALNNWSALVRYTEAGFLSIDNNVAEREMKRIAIGRKNWLFVGSANGGRTAAVLFSFTSTCHRLGVEPWAYLQDVFTRLPQTPAECLADLLPDRWQAARPKAVPNSTTSGGGV
jgi:transposase